MSDTENTTDQGEFTEDEVEELDADFLESDGEEEPAEEPIEIGDADEATDVAEVEEEPQPIVTAADLYKAAGKRKITIVPDEEKITSEKISKHELARLIAVRATQIGQNNIVFTDMTGLTDPQSMAIRELDMQRFPLSVYRIVAKLPAEYKVEIWDVNTMVYNLDI